MPLRPAGPPAPRRARPALTGRAMVLGALVVLLVVVLASPVSRFLASRSAVGSAAQQLGDDRAELGKLRKEQAQYADPGFIQQRARETLNYAMPGDTVYTVIGAHARNEIERTRGAGTGATVAGKAWNARLWDTVRAASG